MEQQFYDLCENGTCDDFKKFISTNNVNKFKENGLVKALIAGNKKNAGILIKKFGKGKSYGKKYVLEAFKISTNNANVDTTTKIIDISILHGCDIEQKYYIEAFKNSCEKKYINFVKFMLDNNYYYKNICVSCVEKQFCIAIGDDNLDIAKILINKFSKPQVCNIFRSACRNDNIDIINFCVDNKTNFEKYYVIACEVNNLKAIKILLKKYPNSFDGEIFNITCEKSNCNIVRYLQKKCKNINYEKALYSACDGNNIEIVKLIISEHRKINPTEAIARTCYHGHKNIIEYFLENFGNINDYIYDVIHLITDDGYYRYEMEFLVYFVNYCCDNDIDFFSYQILEWYMEFGEMDDIKFIINYCTINNIEIDHDGYLIKACKYEDFETVKLIMNYCKDGSYDYKINEIIYQASKNYSDEIINYLIDNCSEEITNHDQLIKWCLNGNNNDILIKFMKSRPDIIDYVFKKACRIDNDKIIKWIIKKNPNIKIKEDDIEYILSICCKYGYLDIVINLIEKNSSFDINRVDLQNIFASCCKSGNLELVKWMHNKYKKYFINHAKIDDFEMDIYVINEQALYDACEYGHYDIITYLLDNFENIDIHFHNEQIFINACRSGNLEVLKMLLIMFPDIDVKVDNGHGFSMACIKGHLEIAKFLKSNFPEIDDKIVIKIHKKHPERFGEEMRKWLKQGCPIECPIYKRIKSAN